MHIALSRCLPPLFLTDHVLADRWPQEIWLQYATETKSLGEFAHPAPGSPAEVRALACLNHLVTDALELVPDCLTYMQGLTHPDIFRFCAIPQVRPC